MTVEFVSQSVIPKNIYVGDKVEVRCNFNLNKLFFGETGFFEFNLSKILFQAETTEYSIEKITFFKNQNHSANYGYTVSVLLQPWTTGELKLLPFELGKEILNQAVEISQVAEDVSALFESEITQAVIYFEPLEVLELATGADSSVRGTDGPLLVPGSLYFVYAIVAAFFVLLIGIVIVGVKLRGVYSSWQNFLAHLYYKKNYKITVKKLKTLLSEKSSIIGDKNFCGEAEKAVRKYLSVRYDYSFESIVTSKIMDTLLDLTANTLSENKTEAAEKIVEVFCRADHIRYAENTFAYVPLQHGEREELVSKCLAAIEQFEV